MYFFEIYFLFLSALPTQWWEAPKGSSVRGNSKTWEFQENYEMLGVYHLKYITKDMVMAIF